MAKMTIAVNNNSSKENISFLRLLNEGFTISGLFLGYQDTNGESTGQCRLLESKTTRLYLKEMSCSFKKP
jgi:hypothetical protein